MLRRSIAKKAVVAVTGLLLFGFVIFHMIGNLQIFLGRESLNHYAELLHAVPELLWVARFVLLAAVGLHILFTILVWTENRQSRPQRYVKERTTRASRASRTMILSGLTVSAFIVYHLLHFTVQATHPEYQKLHELDGQPIILVGYESEGSAEMMATTEGPEAEDSDSSPSESATPRYVQVATEVQREQLTETDELKLRRDVYGMVVASFRSWPIVVVYVIAQILLGFHLSHGASSMFQTLGLTSPLHRPWMMKVGPVFAAIIVCGNLAIPTAVLVDYLAGIGYFSV